jgi:Zn-dependent metalloprotease
LAPTSITNIRAIQKSHATLTAVPTLPGPTAIAVFDCENTTVLPGNPVANPKTSTDAITKQVATETEAVAKFYLDCFGRNSIDDSGMTLQSSVHYGQHYNNAFWDGNAMTNGDGDGQIFLAFAKSNDVIAHELTHGVTEHSAGFVYTNEPGGLNESMSDVFGSMFRQWRAKQSVTTADWLIGSDIMGPGARQRGFTCLRSMSEPGANHALAPQPSHYRDFLTGMDPHESSGIANFAFYQAAMGVGGNSWDTVGKVWYKALTGRRNQRMRMSTFAKRCRDAAELLFPDTTNPN